MLDEVLPLIHTLYYINFWTPASSCSSQQWAFAKCFQPLRPLTQVLRCCLSCHFQRIWTSSTVAIWANRRPLCTARAPQLFNFYFALHTSPTSTPLLRSTKHCIYRAGRVLAEAKCCTRLSWRNAVGKDTWSLPKKCVQIMIISQLQSRVGSFGLNRTATDVCTSKPQTHILKPSTKDSKTSRK